MDFSDIDQFEIETYFSIDNRIHKIKKRLTKLRKTFYDRTMASYCSYNGLTSTFSTVGFNVESNVIQFVDAQLNGEQAIERLLKQKRYLNDYLETLTQDDRDYLMKRYSVKVSFGLYRQVDLDLYEEILEINEAMGYMYGFSPEVTRKTLDNTTLEDDFNDIAAVLGV